MIDLNFCIPLMTSYYLWINPRLLIDEVIQSGLVPRFVQFLQREDFPQLQVDTCSEIELENTEVVIEQGAIPIFVALLSSPSDDVRDQTKPALPALKRLINSTDEVLTDSCWALSYMTVQMKTKLLLRLVHVTDLLSYCFTHLLLYSFNIVTGDDRHPQCIIEL
ncbi:importin subunit alpha-1a-like isoform X2 [Papaver somniferum]|uniref:importin subunit alpha-1a-like isoform X2 n=1 Tax=Papaver somniferum TaxID=3469 RepID=UPI000E7003CA|nr:importin subunit alpha-1a-like isoform X2 [Papaver somniferum]